MTKNKCVKTSSIIGMALLLMGLVVYQMVRADRSPLAIAVAAGTLVVIGGGVAIGSSALAKRKYQDLVSEALDGFCYANKPTQQGAFCWLRRSGFSQAIESLSKNYTFKNARKSVLDLEEILKNTEIEKINIIKKLKGK
jgi:hypothetical protein